MSWLDWMSDFANGARVASSVYDVYKAYGTAKISEVQTEAQKMANEARGIQADNAAQLALWQRQDVIAAGQQDEARLRLKGAATKGSQIAALAGSGVDVNYGSALRAITDTDVLEEQDVNTARQNAAMKAWALENTAIQSANEGKLARAGYVNPAMSVSQAVTGAALSGLSSLAKEWAPSVRTVTRS